MLSIQEMVEETREQRKRIEEVMDIYGCWHPDIKASDNVAANLYAGLKRSIVRDIRDTIHLTPLREFMISGIAGASYLVAPKLHSVLIYNSKLTDIVPLISMQVMEGDWKGSTLNVQIVADENMKPRPVGSGGEAPGGSWTTVQATATPQLISRNVAIEGTLLEDSQYDLIEWYYAQAAKAFGYSATEAALAVLKAAPDGDGTLNSATSATTDTTVWTEILAAIDGIGADEFIANAMLITPEAWEHTAGIGAAVGSAADTYWKPTPQVNTRPPTEGFAFNVQGLDTLFCTSKELHDSGDATGAAFTTCITIVFDRNNAMLTSRKRWLQIENYADPVQDLAGAVVTGRQDSVTVYKDSIYVLTEST